MDFSVGPWEASFWTAPETQTGHVKGIRDTSCHPYTRVGWGNENADGVHANTRERRNWFISAEASIFTIAIKLLQHNKTNQKGVGWSQGLYHRPFYNFIFTLNLLYNVHFFFKYTALQNNLKITFIVWYIFDLNLFLKLKYRTATLQIVC